MLFSSVFLAFVVIAVAALGRDAAIVPVMAGDVSSQVWE